MTKQPNDTAPDLIVLGLEDGQPRAAKFPAGHADLVGKAAKAMNLTVCKAEGPEIVDLAKKLQEGRLYATGRGSVPPIRRDLYDRLVEQLKLAGQPVLRPTVKCRPSRLGQTCQPPGTTLLSATW